MNTVFISPKQTVWVINGYDSSPHFTYQSHFPALPPPTTVYSTQQTHLCNTQSILACRYILQAWRPSRLLIESKSLGIPLSRIYIKVNRSRWPCGLKRGSVAAQFLGLRVRILCGHAYLSLVSVVFCHVEVSASGWSFVQRSTTDCGVSECDREASTMRKPWPTKACRAK